MKAYIINIGDEILIGQIINTNAAWMATELNLNGIHVEKMLTIADTREDILQAVGTAEIEADLVLITGGLGPTKDDITKKTLADHYGMELAYHEESFQNIVELFAQFNRVPDDRYKDQMHMPVGATILQNKRGTAPGMWFEQNDTIIVSMPGVPKEMQYLMQEEVLPRLRQLGEIPAIVHRTLISFGKGETDLSELLEKFEDELPQQVKLAYLPNTSTGYVRLRLSARGGNKAELEALVDAQASKMEDILSYLIIGREHERMEEVVGKILRSRKLKMGTAESCTGGNIAHKITMIPNCSDYYMGSVVAYSNEAKQDILGVQAATLEEHGAVSEQTVREMVQGTLKVLNVDYAIATSGIAGPGGGRPDKPVGTVWVAVGNKDHIETKKLTLGKQRIRNIELSTNIALNILIRLLLNEL